VDTTPKFDLDSDKGRQEFQYWIINLIRNEINSYTRQVIAMSNTNEPNRKITIS
jgi:hypothetical protein